MPMYVPAFFLPTSQGIPYLMEDIYLRGGYRVAATIAARNAISPAARKVGMMVYVIEDKTLYWIPNSTSGLPENVWKPFDATKYVNFLYDEPLSLVEGEDGERTLTIDKARVVPVVEEGEADYMLVATAEGPVWAPKLNLPALEDGSIGDTIVLGPTGDIMWGRASGLPDASTASEGDTVVLDIEGNPVWGRSSGLPSTDGADVGMVVALDADMNPVWQFVDALPSREGAPEKAALALDEQGQPGWISRDELRSNRIPIQRQLGQVVVGGKIDYTLPIECATATLLRVAVSAPDLLLEIHGTPDYSDSNPYMFRSSSVMYEDDGTTVMEDSTVVRSRRYSIFSCPDVANKAMHIRVTNEGQVTADVAVFITYLPTEA